MNCASLASGPIPPCLNYVDNKSDNKYSSSLSEGGRLDPGVPSSPLTLDLMDTLEFLQVLQLLWVNYAQYQKWTEPNL